MMNQFQKNVKSFFITLLGFLIFLPLLHNLYYGNKFVLFTSAVFSQANIKIQIVVARFQEK